MIHQIFETNIQATLAARLRCAVLLGFFAVCLSAPAKAQRADSASAVVSLVASQPGLLVFIDGKEVGQTPLLNFTLPLGEHIFAVRHNLSQSWLESDWSERLTIVAGDSLTLKPQFYNGYSIQSLPAGAQVWVAGRNLGSTPYILRWPDDTSVEVQLLLQNYQSARFEISPHDTSASAHPKRQYQISLVPVPSPLLTQGRDNDLSAASAHQRKWGLIAAGLSLAAGVSAVLFKQEADNAYSDYLVTGAPVEREYYYNRAQQYDRYFGVTFGISQACFVFSVYKFLKSIP